METTKSYRAATVEYFEHVLCEDGKYPGLSRFSEELQYALRCWDEVADHVRKVCSKCRFHKPFILSPFSISLTKLIQSYWYAQQLAKFYLRK
jgi:hypothetical protein